MAGRMKTGPLSETRTCREVGYGMTAGQLSLFDAQSFDLPSPWPCGRCAFCGLTRTERGHDPCIAGLRGVLHACCGHGVEEPYVVLARLRGPQAEEDFFVHARHAKGAECEELAGKSLYGPEAVAEMRLLGGNPPPRLVLRHRGTK